MPEPISVGRAFRRGWWISLVSVVVCVAVSAWVTRRQQPVYEARTMLAVTPNTRVKAVGDVLRSLETLERRTVIATFTRIPESRRYRALAGEAIGMDSANLRRYSVDATVVPSTNIIRLSIQGPDAEAAAALANALADVTRREVRGMYDVFTLRTVSAAEPASRPILPNPGRNAVVAGILGLVIGGVLTVAAEWLSRRPGPAA